MARRMSTRAASGDRSNTATNRSSCDPKNHWLAGSRSSIRTDESSNRAMKPKTNSKPPRAIRPATSRSPERRPSVRESGMVGMGFSGSLGFVRPSLGLASGDMPTESSIKHPV